MVNAGTPALKEPVPALFHLELKSTLSMQIGAVSDYPFGRVPAYAWQRNKVNSELSFGRMQPRSCPFHCGKGTLENLLRQADTVNQPPLQPR